MSGYVKPVVFLFFVVIAAGITGGFMAADRGRNVAGWCLLCALLPPFLILLYFAGPIREVEGKSENVHNAGNLSSGAPWSVNTASTGRPTSVLVCRENVKPLAEVKIITFGKTAKILLVI